MKISRLLIVGFLLLAFACSSPKKKPHEEPWMNADYTLLFRPFESYRALQQIRGKLPVFQFASMLPVLLKNNGVDEKQVWKLFVFVKEKKILLSIQLTDTNLFDNNARHFLSDSSLQRASWKPLRSPYLFLRRIGTTALFFAGEIQTLPTLSELYEANKGKNYTSYRQFLKDKSALFQIIPSERQIQKSGVSNFLVSSKHKKLTARLQAIDNILPQMKPSAWKIKGEIDTNYCALSFNPKEMRSLILRFSDELNWINASFYQKLLSFLNGWEGDFLVLLGEGKTEKTEQIVTELDENFNPIERKIIHENRFQNSVIAVSINEKWSSFENRISMKPFSTPKPQAMSTATSIAPFFKRLETKDEEWQTDWNVSKSHDFFILHRASKCPELIPYPRKTYLFCAGLHLSFQTKKANCWEVSCTEN